MAQIIQREGESRLICALTSWAAIFKQYIDGRYMFNHKQCDVKNKSKLILNSIVNFSFF